MSNAATYVSQPGNPTADTAPGAPGSGGPGAQMGMASALLWVIGTAGVLSFGIGYLGRKGVKPELGRFDVAQVLFTATGTIVVIATGKTIAYRYHGHRAAQAFLLLV